MCAKEQTASPDVIELTPFADKIEEGQKVLAKALEDQKKEKFDRVQIKTLWEKL